MSEHWGVHVGVHGLCLLQLGEAQVIWQLQRRVTLAVASTTCDMGVVHMEIPVV